MTILPPIIQMGMPVEYINVSVFNYSRVNTKNVISPISETPSLLLERYIDKKEERDNYFQY
jgi:hypothetical protein